MEMMIFARQAGTAVFLVTLTLCIQCAGMAVLIRWARANIERGVARLSSFRAAVLMIRSSTLMVVLHFSQIFLWSVFYSSIASSHGVLLLLFGQQLFHGGLW
jgi:hypothetical protein